MALCFTTASSSSSHQTKTFFLQLFIMFLLLLVPFVKTTSFRYNSFEANSQNLNYQGDASARDGGIDLTTNRVDKSLTSSIGRALYKEPVQLYDATTGEEADFITHFTFSISVPTSQTVYGDGLAFFLAPNGSKIPPNAGGGCLGIFNDCSKSNSSENPVVAVEFDTFQNSWDLDFEHVGIDINSISSSVATKLPYSITNGVANVWISYTSSTNKLRVNLTHDELAVRRSQHLFLSLDVNLRDKLPEWVNVGFSATTGTMHELHKILSWEFNSTNFPSRVTDISPSPSPTSNNLSSNFTDISPRDSASSTGTGEGKKKVNTKLLIGFGVCGSFIVVGVSYILFVCRKKIKIIKTSQQSSQ